ncbi:MAG: DNA internalization-related competence protein ComEC/Rec2 [Bacillota bacterium]
MKFWRLEAPCLILLLPLLVGIIIGAQFDLSLLLLLISSLIFSILVVISWYYQSELTVILILILILLLGCTLVQRLEFRYHHPQSIRNYAGIDLILKGRITKVELTAQQQADYTIKPRQIKINQEWREVKYGQLLIKDFPHRYTVGDLVEVRGQLELPPTNRNPGEFSYRKYLYRNGIYLLASNPALVEMKLVAQQGNYLVRLINYFKTEARQIIDQTLTEPNNYLIRGLLLGERNLVPQKISQQFRELGLSHLLVISGFHVSLLILIIGSILNSLQLPPLAKNIGLILLISGYLLLVGFQPSILRVSIVVILYLIGVILERESNIYNLLALAAGLMLIYNPYYLFQVGFQLSFSIVLTIIYLTPELEARLSLVPNFIATSIAVSVAALIGAAPLLIFHFNYLSFVPLVGNFLVLPLVSLIIFFSFIGLMLGNLHLIFAELLNGVTALLLDWLLRVVYFLDYFKFLSWRLVRPNYLVIGLYYFLVYQLRYLLAWEVVPGLYRKGKRIIVTLLIILVVCLIINFNFFGHNNLEIIFLDVGQGDAAFLTLDSGAQVLVDGGGDGDRVADFFYHNGVRSLDLLIISHFHRDHIRGLVRVLEEFTVKQVLMPQPVVDNSLVTKLYKIMNEEEINYQIIEKSGALTLVNTKLDFYNLDISDPSANNNSLVVRLDYDRFQLLLMGDGERELENYLLSKKLELASEVLKVGHHGSATSSQQSFLRKVSPQLAVISVGKDNQYNLPDSNTTARLEEISNKVLMTKEQGAVIIQSNGQQFWLED